MICLGLNLNSQQDLQTQIGMGFETDGQDIKLRWAPLNPDIWEGIIEHGISLNRQEYIVNGDTIDIVTRSNNTIPLVQGYKPLTQTEWEIKFPNDSLAIASSGVLYSDITNPSYCLLYTSPSPRDQRGSRMPSSA